MLQKLATYGALSAPVLVFFSYRLNLEYFALFGLPSSFVSFTETHLLLRGIDHLLLDLEVALFGLVIVLCVLGYESRVMIKFAGKTFPLTPVFLVTTFGSLALMNGRVSEIGRNLYVRDVFQSTTTLDALLCTEGENKALKTTLLDATSRNRPLLILRMNQDRIVAFLAPPVELGTPGVELLYMRIDREDYVRTSKSSIFVTGYDDPNDRHCPR
ncbi:hypothetical protein [Ruegeria sp. HKCCD8929]|uniref:hypothetical protein n=1 Tax=Ruegeria sp. HKCCD8929 TaxID=2683006 RepID=UPI00148948DE|nr:hypothetical protein [Ruegeria sp. HKCCD8929]